eukprot:TRINITY_DN3355_c0_g1_i3.p1 TRINITY_DN3355_c0_g1~~TRINITY_DN3355_c0_g1_i3.p1  ORF type:complete len:257 (+),score=84.01 TRINITY_DN3355_c0_g1_i3:59-772(+)
MSSIPLVFGVAKSSTTRAGVVVTTGSLVQRTGVISPSPSSSSQFSTSEPPPSSSSHHPHDASHHSSHHSSDPSYGGPVPLSNSCPDPSSCDLRSSGSASSSSSATSSSSFSGSSRPSHPAFPPSSRAPPPQKQLKPMTFTRCACPDCDREASPGFQHCNRTCAKQQCNHHRPLSAQASETPALQLTWSTLKTSCLRPSDPLLTFSDTLEEWSLKGSSFTRGASPSMSSPTSMKKNPL